jgi:molecular chaperone DnaK
MAGDNKTLGRFQLSDIPPARRGEPQVEVTFDIDANGIMSISAKDKATGKEQSIRIEASSGLSDAEIDKMKKEAEANAEADNKTKEKVDKLNAADNLIFQTEKQLKEYGDKIPSEKKEPIETALNELKEVHKSENIEAIDAAMETLNIAFQAASEEMYAAQAAEGQQGADASQEGSDAKAEDEVTDVDFEEVK